MDGTIFCWRRNIAIMGLVFGLGMLAGQIIAGEGGTSDRSIPVSQATQAIQLPPGFRATLFAGEPDVRQPIAMTFDDRGRLWVAECHTYSDAKTNFDLTLQDRIVIFEDPQGTGRFERRKVFWDQGKRLTGIALGFGGVYATCAPHLVFIPDRNSDDIPDGAPEILLDGWNDSVVRHNIVNGLKWGPDGWLYGRHGIQATSIVGKPGAPKHERTALNCAIWRYHPTRRTFEVVFQGGTNPWGHDWDAYGELFFINTVIGHLWHGIPGAYYQRMYGEHLARYRYGLIDQAADHYHWDTGKSWTDSRNAGAGADALGGGHAHAGMMIYLGDNWPERYRNQLFTLNFHGRRINRERLERQGSGMTGRHEPDMVKFADPWFRGIELDYGPDGGVYVLDWSDTGECHENDADGVHRETGRIFKIVYDGEGKRETAVRIGPTPQSLLTNSLANLPDEELLRLQLHPNEWYVRHARRILQERSRTEERLAELHRKILQKYAAQNNVVNKLRFMFTLHAVGGDSETWLKQQLQDADDRIRAWAVRFLAESGTNWETLVPVFARLAASDPSPTVRLHLASVLQRVPEAMREPLALALLQHGEDAADQNLPLMLWYGVEPVAARHPVSAVRLAELSRIPLVRQNIARRLTEQLDDTPEPVNALLQAAAKADATMQMEILRGVAEALRGWRKAPKPSGWDEVRSTIASSGNRELQSLARQLGLIFGDPAALEELMQIARNSQADPESRRAAARQILEARPPNMEQVLESLLPDPVTAGIAGRGLLVAENPARAGRVLQHWKRFSAEDRAAVAGLMVARVSSAKLLLQAIANGQIPRSALTAFEARQIRSLNDKPLSELLAGVWGEVRAADADKEQVMARYQRLLKPDRVKQADLGKGRETFNQVCATCHKLYGEGAAIGPDLTGGGRANLDYLLENIVDPSGIVPADYKVSEIELTDDRVFSALILSKTERTLTLQTPNEQFTVERREVAHLRESNVSLMPEGLLQGLTDEQIINLMGYLMAPSQVPLPRETRK